jgi:hypothetical protein
VSDLTSFVALGISAIAVLISLFGYFEERHKRRLLEKMVKQLVKLARSQERQVRVLRGLSTPKSAEELKIERDKLTWDQIKTLGRALGFDVDE